MNTYWKRVCERDAAWDEFCEYPSGEAWDIFCEAEREEKREKDKIEGEKENER